ncbi:hypothetical protein NLJ89_g4684 [Agrocybe chaxingu]|uniref:non-specific serine/threonine protein kinase n=1 Tax=Agrocybe chaxingu TaxID=84603 RepID=A0A9W8K2F4_9AGAR|nr:hypothetical protein NLJ89_g4684 [Agrocybe chaxingu]
MVLFPEEQLDSSVGYFVGRLGMTLQEGKWGIIRKLGWGRRSSTWLVVDTADSTDVRAIKIFTIEESRGSVAAKEVGVLKELRATSPLHISWLHDHFHEHSTKGDHLCLVFHPYGKTIESLRQTNTVGGYLALHIAKQVAGEALAALAELHENNITHGAVTADHFVLGMLDEEDVRAAGHTADAVEEELIDGDGVQYTIVRSRPLEPAGWDSKWNDPAVEFAGKSVDLIGLGHARRKGSDAPGTVARSSGTPIPPEALKGGDIGFSSDIWQFGCLAFHLVTGTPFLDETYLASPDEFLTRNLSEMEARLSSTGSLAEADILMTASFLRACLALDPARRPNSEEVFDHEWMRGGDVCTCGWSADKD